MQSYLKTVFGLDITVEEFDYPDNTPFYIRDGYRLQCLSWNKNRCVILSPNFSWRLPTIKKQLLNFQEICDIPCALCLENISVMQRRNLIESKIPFIALSQQIYLPFWGCAFFERFKEELTVTGKMAPGTQLVFLYLYYLQNTDNINLTLISQNLQLSKATCNRAINDLVANDLISLQSEGTNKWIKLSYNKPEFLKKGYARLKSPVERVIYVKEALADLGSIKSGILALSEISMVGVNENDGAIAVSKKTATTILTDNIISEHQFQDFGGHVVQVWSYDPIVLSHDNRVDDISLLLSLEHYPNERVQMGLDEIRARHELPIKTEE